MKGGAFQNLKSSPRTTHYSDSQPPRCLASDRRAKAKIGSFDSPSRFRSRMSARHEKEKGVNVQVLLRCRPFSDEELRTNAPQVVTCNEYQREVSVSQNIAGKHLDRVFMFDKVFGPSAQQKDLYEQAVVPIVNEVLEGFNCTIFAYGQTGTGKTYTMEGECKRSKSGLNGELPSEAGVIPRAVKQIFDTLESQNAEYSVKVTFIELYNEEITDLLAPEELSKVVMDDKQKKQLLLMEDGKGGVLVRGIEEEIVTTATEIFTLLERGSSKRRTAETMLNKQSSRSHSLFSITIHIKEATPEGEELIKCGKLNLVDLAGSENISRSGAREGRAREAGEINKSLLTLGRVINALVEHLGHIPYRDSKLTRLLRDSLGGRTKTCIIATVSPAVHCLEETLSTLDYAHRAKNIKNKPEVNQKMMKSTLIKDLYGEIDRLKAEVYAAREKNGVYIPKERFYQEESERKAMAEQIEQMGVLLETNQKQLEDVQEKLDAQVKECSELTNNLHATEKDLEQTRIMLASTREDLKKCQYLMKERDFVIQEQRKAEDALAHQACVLRADLEKSLKDNNLLFSKIAREDKLNADNKAMVTDYFADLAKNVALLANVVTGSASQQDVHLCSVEKLCCSFQEIHNAAVVEIRKKVAASKAVCISHIEAMQNIVRLHKASSGAGLENISSAASSYAENILELMMLKDEEAKKLFEHLQETVSTLSQEMALFTGELRERFSKSIGHAKGASKYTNELLERLLEEIKKLEDHATQFDELQMNGFSEFQKAYDEQSKHDEEKLLADMTSLVTSHMRRQKELVDARLLSITQTTSLNKSFLDRSVSSMEGITTDAKRKWHEFHTQAENDASESSDYTAAKHCRMESLFEKCGSATEAVSNHGNGTRIVVCDVGKDHALSMESLVRGVLDANEQHDVEVCSAKDAAEKDIIKCSESLTENFQNLSEQEQGLISGILDAGKAHSVVLGSLRDEHCSQASAIGKRTVQFQQQYMDYEPSGTTPVRSDPVIPSKGTIESLRAMPMEDLLEEFRENNSFESFELREVKPSLVLRSPLMQIN
ncbi:hypothetical protein MLD38_016009 [Melastoma candidum]|uniref:Uncharacterized protein n=1 Tax=Melastoma candidum TaxID=119954 RepID=A0ACB9RIM6_9MYRT|nr:hypothetical protein MLD38_016009 [Melastoma candidum]